MKWRIELLNRSSGTGGVTHGVAAKFINVFLKAIFVCGADATFETPSEIDEKRRAIHPPIDRVLLRALTVGNVAGYGRHWKKLHDIGWSNFTSEDYQEAIGLIGKSTTRGLWEIERHWIGYQSQALRSDK